MKPACPLAWFCKCGKTQFVRLSVQYISLSPQVNRPFAGLWKPSKQSLVGLTAGWNSTHSNCTTMLSAWPAWSYWRQNSWKTIMDSHQVLQPPLLLHIYPHVSPCYGRTHSAGHVIPRDAGAKKRPLWQVLGISQEDSALNPYWAIYKPSGPSGCMLSKMRSVWDYAWASYHGNARAPLSVVLHTLFRLFPGLCIENLFQ